MKTYEQSESRALTQVWPAVALALAGVWLAGCHTTVYQQGDRAAASSRAAATELQTQSQALEGTTATLSNLVYKPAPDLKPQFQSFSAALDGLAAAARRGGVTGSQLERSNALYFDPTHHDHQCRCSQPQRGAQDRGQQSVHRRAHSIRPGSGCFVVTGGLPSGNSQGTDRRPDRERGRGRQTPRQHCQRQREQSANISHTGPHRSHGLERRDVLGGRAKRTVTGLAPSFPARQPVHRPPPWTSILSVGESPFLSLPG